MDVNGEVKLLSKFKKKKKKKIFEGGGVVGGGGGWGSNQGGWEIARFVVGG